MSFDFLGPAPNIYGQQTQMYQNPMTPQPQFDSSAQQIVQYQQPVPQPRPQLPPVKVVSNNSGEYVPNFKRLGTATVSDPVIVEEKKKRSYNRKTGEVEVGKPNEVIRSEDKTPSTALSGSVEDVPTSYTYSETTGMLRETLAQIDAISSELVQEFTNVRASRTMKNKYMALTNISDNLGSLLSSKIAAIREINSSISKSNDLDYKKYKDIKAAQGAMDDDKYIADLYKGFITNTASQIPQPNMPAIPTAMNMGSGIIRANIDNNGSFMGGDQAYMSYLANLTPEQNLMRYESNPNVEQVVVFDHATGNKFFQMMDLASGQVITNVPVYDDDIMQDTTLDLNKGIAKNLNLNQSFKIIEINKESVMNQY